MIVTRKDDVDGDGDDGEDGDDGDDGGDGGDGGEVDVVWGGDSCTKRVALDEVEKKTGCVVILLCFS